MPEKKYQVQTYEVEFECEEEGCNGVYRHSGQCLLSNPAQYPHTCNECGHNRTFRGKVYPHIVRERIFFKRPAPDYTMDKLDKLYDEILCDWTPSEKELKKLYQDALGAWVTPEMKKENIKDDV